MLQNGFVPIDNLAQLLPNLLGALLGKESAFSGALTSRAKKNIVFLLVDGLGAISLAEHIQNFPTLSQMSAMAPIKSTFPSTTASALTSLSTGQAPGVHGMLGYTTRVPNSGYPQRLLNALKWDPRVDPTIWQSQATLFEQAAYRDLDCTYIAAKRYEGTGFTEATLRGAQYLGENRIEGMVSSARRILQSATRPQFIYMYVNFVDQAGHSDGVASARWLEALWQVEELMTMIKDQLDALLVVSSDHGMLTSDNQIVVDQKLLKGVALLGGEPRMRHLYLDQSSPSAIAAVKENWLVANELSEKVELLTRAQASQLFGGLSSTNSERAGDLIAIPKSDWLLIEHARLAQEGAMKGHHGGASEIEMQIPLLFS